MTAMHMCTPLIVSASRRRDWRTRKSMHGITLLELMIVVTIVAILAGIAVPNYRAYMMRTNRTDATAALLRLAAAQEKFYLQNNTYATNAQLSLAPPFGLGINGTERGYYNLSIPDASGSRFRAQATAPSTSSQFSDGECRSFSITETGQRGAVNASSGANTNACWR